MQFLVLVSVVAVATAGHHHVHYDDGLIPYVVNPGGIGGIYKGPDSATIIKGPDGGVIRSKQIGGAVAIEDSAPVLVPITGSERVVVGHHGPVVAHAGVLHDDGASVVGPHGPGVSTGAIHAGPVSAGAIHAAPVTAGVIHTGQSSSGKVVVDHVGSHYGHGGLHSFEEALDSRSIHTGPVSGGHIHVGELHGHGLGVLGGLDVVDTGSIHAGPVSAGSIHAGPVSAGSIHVAPSSAGTIHAGPVSPGHIHVGGHHGHGLGVYGGLDVVDTGSIHAGPVSAGSIHAGPVSAGSIHVAPSSAGSIHAGPVSPGHIQVGGHHGHGLGVHGGLDVVNAGSIHAGPVSAGSIHVGASSAGSIKVEPSSAGAIGVDTHLASHPTVIHSAPAVVLTQDPIIVPDIYSTHDPKIVEEKVIIGHKVISVPKKVEEDTDLIGPSGTISTRGGDAVISGPASITVKGDGVVTDVQKQPDVQLTTLEVKPIVPPVVVTKVATPIITPIVPAIHPVVEGAGTIITHPRPLLPSVKSFYAPKAPVLEVNPDVGHLGLDHVGHLGLGHHGRVHYGPSPVVVNPLPLPVAGLHLPHYAPAYVKHPHVY